MSRKKRRKPRGEVGPIVIGPTKGEGGFKPLELPITKEEIEEYIVAGALSTARRLGANLYRLIEAPVRTKESDFDFTLKTQRGEEYLELTEIAPLELTGGRYDGAPVSYHQGAMAELAYGLIARKAIKYGPQQNARIHLLAYATDWKFQLSQGVLALMAYWNLQRAHPFASIVYFLPVSSDNGDLKILYPTSPEVFATFDEEQARNRLILRPDFTKLHVKADGIEAPLSWPPWRGAG